MSMMKPNCKVFVKEYGRRRKENKKFLFSESLDSYKSIH